MMTMPEQIIMRAVGGLIPYARNAPHPFGRANRADRRLDARVPIRRSTRPAASPLVRCCPRALPAVSLADKALSRPRDGRVGQRHGAGSRRWDLLGDRTATRSD